MQQAAAGKRASGRRTIVFVDEIHRFNKAPAGCVLAVRGGRDDRPDRRHHRESASFEINAALLSRRGAVWSLFRRRRRGCRSARSATSKTAWAAWRWTSPTTFSRSWPPNRRRRSRRAQRTGVRGRLGTGGRLGAETVGLDHLKSALQKAAIYHDRAGEAHFNLISALHKSMRNSDPDATMYWLARMLEAGDDPLYVARRIVRFASEDIGLADPAALTLALAAKEAVHFVGRPEADLALGPGRRVRRARAEVQRAVHRVKRRAGVIREGSTDPVPMAIRNAVTGLMN